MRDDFEVSDTIMDHFFAYASKRYGTKFKPTAAEQAKPSPQLRAVTAENAHEFAPVTKRRGRLPKVRTGGNVVAFPLSAPRPNTEYERQKLRVAELLNDRLVKAGRPRMGTKAMLALIDSVASEVLKRNH